MIKIEHLEVSGISHAIRGMRNPLNSWDKSDSFGDIIGKNDLDLMKRLYKAGTDHRKYLRQVIVHCDITAPLYWWKQFDQYKVGVTTNSTSTMHKIMSKPFEEADFSYDTDYRATCTPELAELLEEMAHREMYRAITECNSLRDMYLREHSPYFKSKGVWRILIQKLPSSYNQTRTVSMSLENVINMFFARKTHKLVEWAELCGFMLENLPYLKELIEE